MKHVNAWACALAFALLFFGSLWIVGPDDIDAENRAALSLSDSLEQARADAFASQFPEMGHCGALIATNPEIQ